MFKFILCILIFYSQHSCAASNGETTSEPAWPAVVSPSYPAAVPAPAEQMSEKKRGKQPVAPPNPAPASAEQMSAKKKGKQPINAPAAQPPNPKLAANPNPGTNVQGMNLATQIGDAIQHLMSLGFPYELCQEAVSRFGSNLEQAVNWMADRMGNQNNQNMESNIQNQIPRQSPQRPKTTGLSRGEAMRRLIALGFDFTLCREAVNRFGGDVDAAAHWISQQFGPDRRTGAHGTPASPKQGGIKIKEPGSGGTPTSTDSQGSATYTKKEGKQPMKSQPPPTQRIPATKPVPSRPIPPRPPRGTNPNNSAGLGDAIQALTLMGFNIEQSVEAANRFHGDVNAATEWIISEQSVIRRPARPIPPVASNPLAANQNTGGRTILQQANDDLDTPPNSPDSPPRTPTAPQDFEFQGDQPPHDGDDPPATGGYTPPAELRSSRSQSQLTLFTFIIAVSFCSLIFLFRRTVSTKHVGDLYYVEFDGEL